MKINKIVLKNLFSFYGKQEIFFDKKTAILAENGFGKTSILNAIKLAFGQRKVKIESILNSSATDKECFIEIDFDKFILKRVWDFDKNLEDLTIFLKEDTLKDYEAEEFIKEKFPVELLDFIFFDGEVEKDLILLKSKKIKRIFEYSFDLDVISNMVIDTKKVANRLLNRFGSDEVIEFKALQERERELEESLIVIEKKEEDLKRDIRKLKEQLRLNELKIRNRSKSFDLIQKKIDENRNKLLKEIEIFQQINLYQLPLLFNEKLLNKINKEENTQIIEILDKKEFKNRFYKFINSIDSSLEKEKLLKEFERTFNIKEIELIFSKEDIIQNLKNLSHLINIKNNLQKELQEIKETIFKKSNLKELEVENIKLKKAKEQKELELNELYIELENLNREYKDIQKQLRLEFINRRDKYIRIKAIEELYNISEVAKEIYYIKLKENLNRFNTLFKNRVKPFLDIYMNIEKIYINDKFKIIIEDKNEKILDITLLSAGQKQILSFILITTILEFNRFVDFIFIDTPFGRLSNKNRDFIFNNYYLNFSHLTLLVTSSEYEYLKKQHIDFKLYKIIRDEYGSKICEVKNG